jgi:hypothetical protein
MKKKFDPNCNRFYGNSQSTIMDDPSSKEIPIVTKKILTFLLFLFSSLIAYRKKRYVGKGRKNYI